IRPQQRTPPLTSTAHAPPLPTVIAFAGPGRPRTLTGTAESVWPPLPRIPCAPDSSPQQRTAPPATIAHASKPPRAIARTPLPSPATRGGTALSRFFPLPSSPSLPKPQQRTVPPADISTQEK